MPKLLQQPVEKPFGIDGTLSITNAAKLMGVSRDTVRALVADGRLRQSSIQVGTARKKPLICKRSILDYLSSREE